jgi:hypothetical protein
MHKDGGQINFWLWLSLPITILLVIAASAGVFITNLYRDVPYFVVQARAQDLISLVVVAPTLAIAAYLASRGSVRAKLIWLGVLIYLVYTYVIAAFDDRFNALFLVYVALLGCSLYALIGGLVTADLARIKAFFSEKAPVKVVSIYLAVLAIVFYLMWLSEVVPALKAGQIPQSIQDNGTPTNAVHVLDMAWILPAFVIASVSVWRRRALGFALAGAILSYIVLLVLAIMAMVVFMMRRGYPIFVPQVAIFGALFIISLGLLIWYMGSSKTRPVSN